MKTPLRIPIPSKLTLFLTLTISLTLNLTSCTENTPVKEKTVAASKDNLPEDVSTIKNYLIKHLPEVRIQVVDYMPKGVYELRVMREDGSILFTYNLVPSDLSDKDKNTYIEMGMKRSCLFDTDASMSMKYNGTFLFPSCGNLKDHEEAIAAEFYQVLKALGARETSMVL